MKLAFALAAMCVFAAPRRAQESPRVDERADLTTRVVFVGTVVTAAGLPAAGALVVSSAGGEAVTRGDGRFELSAQVPLTAQSVEVTATVSGGKLRASMSASVRILPAALSPTTSVGTLVVSQGTDDPRWLSTFGGLPGVSGTILAMTVFDHGTGPALYVSGTFFGTAGGVEANRLACWDGRRWSAIGGPLVGGPYSVNALTVFDDGSGPALYVGGVFTSMGGVPASNIARWDGSNWSALGSGLNATVQAFQEFDDGSGPALYVAGNFSLAGGSAANHIARWNGASWSALGSGLDDGAGRALSVFDAGSGPALYAGGSFTTAGGVAANRIARWDGVGWSALGAGLSGGAGIKVQSLVVHDDGGGAALYAGGHFQVAGGVSASSIARWNGASWAPASSGTNGDVLTLKEFDDGSGPALYAGGQFLTAGGVTVNQIARWNGTSWSALDGGLGGTAGFTHADALAVYDDGHGPRLYAGGIFTQAGSAPAQSIARLEGSHWAALGRGMAGQVNAFTVGDDGSGQALYAGGQFSGVGRVLAKNVARWNGSSWTALGSGMTPGPGTSSPSVQSLAFYDSGGGPALYAGGTFERSGATVVDGIARWNGAQWTAVGGGYHGRISALCVFDDGSGPALYTGSSDVPVSRWNGTSWANLSSGMNDGVNALAVFDDGSGPALYAGGAFTTASGASRNHIARWNGSSWIALSTGMAKTVRALAVFDDGGGPALYAAGGDSPPGGVATVGRWDGTSWTAVGSGMGGVSIPRVYSLAILDDGRGPALYAGGSFLDAGGVAAPGIARWDGSSWSPLGAGLSGTGLALARFDDGSGPALLVGGVFGSPTGDTNLAKWGHLPRVRESR